MHAMVVVLNKTEYLDEILERLAEIGIGGATIFDTQGMASALAENHSEDIPIIGILRGLVDSSRPYNKTFFSIVESEEAIDQAVDIFNEVVGDINEPGTGLIFTIPIGKSHGIRAVKN